MTLSNVLGLICDHGFFFHHYFYEKTQKQFLRTGPEKSYLIIMTSFCNMGLFSLMYDTDFTWNPESNPVDVVTKPLLNWYNQWP